MGQQDVEGEEAAVEGGAKRYEAGTPLACHPRFGMLTDAFDALVNYERDVRMPRVVMKSRYRLKAAFTVSGVRP